MPYGGNLPAPLPAPIPTPGPWFDLTDRRLTAAVNVLVFTPYAVYLARGKRPPGWLIAASLGWLALQFAEDLRYLLVGEAAELGNLTKPGHPPPPHPMTLIDARSFRVNRT